MSSPVPTTSGADDPVPTWTENLLSDTRAVVMDLLQEPAVPIDFLREQIEQYAVAIEEAFHADKETGRLLVRGALQLLDASIAEAHWPLVQVAVRYFVLDDDGDDDLASPFGFDDDVEVFNAIVGYMGMNGLLIQP